MTPAVIFGVINLSNSIAGYLGLIENVGSNVKKLLHQSFKSAIQNIEYAKSANGQNQLDYIRRAKEQFIDAVSVEENENLISSLMGLAMCQYLLGDHFNSTKTIARIKDVNLTLSEKTKATSKIALKMMTMPGNLYVTYKLLRGENPYSDYTDRIAKFEEYKQLALATK